MPKKPKTLENLLALTRAQETQLRDRIRQWNGLVRIFIHPMYEKWKGHELTYRNDPKGRRLLDIERVLKYLLEMPIEKAPPIIIFEEEIHLKKLEKWAPRDCYVIPTEEDHPVPCGYLLFQEEGWRAVGGELDTLGVRKIILGGVRLETCSYKTDWTGKSPYMCRCVGIALSYLSKRKGGRFDIAVSALTDPAGSHRVFQQHIPH